MIGTVVVIIAGHTFVASIPADAAAKTGFVPGLMYYSVGFMIFLAVLWFAVENKRFKGPPLGDEIANRQAGIALQEKALSAGG